ncbi:hypothetical protein N7G274_003552 [Stereocaulon virgatum]|uniref:Uncharacterized protein n=1 Tax=Stereocaulon virgatum TaxID=373712 RepID=A0ABR4AGR4_9LECA
MVSQPKLTLRLQADRLCLLNHQSRFSLVIFLTLTSGQPVTLIRSGCDGHIGLKEFLVSRCIECTHVESGQRVSVLESSQGPQSINPEAACPPKLTLEPNKSNYMTFTTAINPRDFEFTLNLRALEPDCTYKIQCKPSALRWWTYDSQETINEYFMTYRKLPPPETPPLRCEPPCNDSIITFNTRSELKPAPEVSVSLFAPSTMSLSSNPKYLFSLTFTSHAGTPITVLAERDSTKAGNTDMKILDGATRKRLAPDLIDSGNDDGPWLREDFLRLEPGVPYVEHRTFDPAYKYSGLEDLEVNTEYVLRMVNSKWAWWSFDDVDTVMSYAGERGSGRWGSAQSIQLVCGDEARFRAVS